MMKITDETTLPSHKNVQPKPLNGRLKLRNDPSMDNYKFECEGFHDEGRRDTASLYEMWSKKVSLVGGGGGFGKC